MLFEVFAVHFTRSVDADLALQSFFLARKHPSSTLHHLQHRDGAN